MGFYRSYPLKDTFITNKIINNDIAVRATGSNNGVNPSLSLFAFTPDVASGTMDLSRVLMQFNLTELSGKIYSERTIPSSSVSYYLKMYDMKHDETVPTSFDLFVYPLSRSWDEGSGSDSDNFRDYGYANWYMARSTAAWASTGSDFLTTGYGSGSQHFDSGQEDLEVDITNLVVNWLTSSLLPNNGLVVKLGATEENSTGRYYRKAFHGRETKYIERLPYIEARWNSVETDNRNNFAYDINNKLFMYNFVRGDLSRINETVTVRIQDNLVRQSASFTGSYPTYQTADGILTASILVEHTGNTRFSGTFYDIWESSTRVYMTGTFKPLRLTGSQYDPYNEFVVNVSNLKRMYSTREDARVIVKTRKKDWVTHVGVLSSGSAQLSQDKEYIEKMYYSIENDDNGAVIIPFGTGSLPWTQLSYNADGNFFDLYMNAFIPGFVYRIKFLIDINRFDKKVIDNDFLFKVVD
jgi:hypothetical protein